MNRAKRLKIFIAIQLVVIELVFALYMFISVARRRQHGRITSQTGMTRRYRMSHRIPDQMKHLRGIIEFSDAKCLDNLRMSRNAFGRLCQLLEISGGLKDTVHVSVVEQVAMFLSILAHHKKNCVVKHDFICSGRTVSKHFHSVLKAVLRLNSILLVRPAQVSDDYPEQRWRWFKGCLGALDGTHIAVRVPDSDKGRYRNRKGQISVNVLGVCNMEGKFIFVLSGWEGSAADGRVLRDALHRTTGLKIPNGNYYLCDNGYNNVEGFLTPYRGVRYHLKEWERGTCGPQNAKELFNLRHAFARNVIERTFGLLKAQWGILRSHSYYPISVQKRIIVACCLLHNFCRMEMPDDPLEPEGVDLNDIVNDGTVDYVSNLEASTAWTMWRDELANNMWNDWLSHR